MVSRSSQYRPSEELGLAASRSDLLITPRSIAENDSFRLKTEDVYSQRVICRSLPLLCAFA